MKAIINNKITEFIGSINSLINFRMEIKNTVICVDYVVEVDSNRWVATSYNNIGIEESSGYEDLIFISPEEASSFFDGYVYSTVEYYGRESFSWGSANGNMSGITQKVEQEVVESRWYEIGEEYCNWYSMAIIDKKYKIFFPIWEELALPKMGEEGEYEDQWIDDLLLGTKEKVKINRPDSIYVPYMERSKKWKNGNKSRMATTDGIKIRYGRMAEVPSNLTRGSYKSLLEWGKAHYLRGSKSQIVYQALRLAA